jgi:NADPH:quinone reductase-like Zn-dependent oxidoreductase
MHVIEVSRFGGPEVLTPRRAPDPVAGPGQVVIRTAAVDVLFIDTAIRAGHAVDFFDIRPPYVPGNGVSGEVISTGDEVDRGWVGQSRYRQDLADPLTERPLVTRDVSGLTFQPLEGAQSLHEHP